MADFPKATVVLSVLLDVMAVLERTHMATKENILLASISAREYCLYIKDKTAVISSVKVVFMEEREDRVILVLAGGMRQGAELVCLEKDFITLLKRHAQTSWEFAHDSYEKVMAL